MLVCVRWYVAYPLSFRNIEEMMAERGVFVEPRLRHLGDQRLRVAQQEVHQRRGTVELLLHERGSEAIAMAGALHDGAARCRLSAH